MPTTNNILESKAKKAFSRVKAFLVGKKLGTRREGVSVRSGVWRRAIFKLTVRQVVAVEIIHKYNECLNP